MSSPVAMEKACLLFLVALWSLQSVPASPVKGGMPLVRRTDFNQEGDLFSYQLPRDLVDQNYDSVVDDFLLTLQPSRSGNRPLPPTTIPPSAVRATDAPEIALAQAKGEDEEQVSRPEPVRPCQPKNRTITIRRKQCETMTFQMRVCEGACTTQVHSQKRFPYLARECRSCQPDTSVLEKITVLQGCKKRGRLTFTKFTLPNPTRCQCADCFSDWTLSYPAEKERLTVNTGLFDNHL